MKEAMRSVSSWLAAGTLTFASMMASSAPWAPNAPTGASASAVSLLAEHKVIDSAGWPLRAPSERWQEAAATIANDASWKGWVADRRALVDNWIAKREDHVDWIVGWAHDYVNTDGTSRSWNVDVVPTEDPNTPTGRKLREAWYFYFRHNHTDRIVEAARLYRLTGQEGYAQWAASQLDFYAANYDKWPIQRRLGTSRLMGQSLDEAVVILKLLEAGRLLDLYATPDRKSVWATSLFRPVAETLDKSYNGLNNISCWLRSAQGAIAAYLNDPDMMRRATEGSTGLRELLRVGINADSIWYEGSMGYTAYVVRALTPFFEAVARSGQGAAFTTEMLQVQNMMVTPMLLRFPDNSLPNPSDNIGRLKAPDYGLLTEARRVLPTKLGNSLASSRKSWEQLIDPPDAVSLVPSLPKVSSRVLTASQMAIVKNDAWQIFTHWGQSVANHAQREALNLEVFAGDEPLSRDPGTTLYGSPLYGGYFSQPAAHNVPFADDKGQLAWAPGELQSFEASTSSLVVSQPKYNASISAKRSIRLSGTTFVDELNLSPLVGSSTPSSVGATWHFDCKLSGFENMPTSSMRLPSGEGFLFWTDVQAFSLRDQANLTLSCGTKTVNLRVDLSGDFTLFKGSAPEVPPKKRDAIYIRRTTPSATIRLSFQSSQ